MRQRFKQWCEDEDARWYNDKNHYRMRLVVMFFITTSVFVYDTKQIIDLFIN